MAAVCTDDLKPLHKRLLDYINDNGWTFDIAVEYPGRVGKLWTLNGWNGVKPVPIAFFYINNNIDDKNELAACMIREATKPARTQQNLIEIHDKTLKEMMYMKSQEEISLILAALGY